MTASSSPSRPPIRALLAAAPSPGSLALARWLGEAEGFALLGVAESEVDAVARVIAERPDLVVLDHELPGEGVRGTIAAIRARLDVPIVVVLEPDLPRLAGGALWPLRAGAADVVPRPASSAPPELRPFLAALRGAATRGRGVGPALMAAAGPPPPPVAGTGLIAIGASTGGPHALRQVLTALPADFPVPLMVVQHLAPGFMGDLASWLAGEVALPVRAAADGARLTAPGVYLCPEGFHAEVGADGRIFLDPEPRGLAHQPAVDVLFWSAAAAFGARAVGVLLTGMGDDGARGLWRMRRAGAVTIVQDANSSVVFGMPGAALARDAAAYVLSPEAIGRALAGLGVAARDAGGR